MVAAGPVAAAVVTEVGWIENQGALMLRRACREAVIVEMLVSALGAVKGISRLPSIITNDTEGSAHLCVNQSVLGSAPRFCLEKYPKDAPPPMPITTSISKEERVEDKEIRTRIASPV